MNIGVNFNWKKTIFLSVLALMFSLIQIHSVEATVQDEIDAKNRLLEEYQKQMEEYQSQAENA